MIAIAVFMVAVAAPAADSFVAVGRCVAANVDENIMDRFIALIDGYTKKVNEAKNIKELMTVSEECVGEMMTFQEEYSDDMLKFGETVTKEQVKKYEALLEKAMKRFETAVEKKTKELVS